MEERKRARWLVPADWPIFHKILAGVVAVVALALGVTGYVNVRTLQSDLRERIGLEFEALAVAQTGRLVDILSENVTVLENITLIDSVRAHAATANERYAGYGDNRAAIETDLLAVDEQWRAASEDSQLVQSIISPQFNSTASQLLSFQGASPDHVEIFLTDRYGGLLASTGRTSDYYQADEEWWQAAFNDGHGALYISQPGFDESAGYTALNIAAPIRSDGGEVIGVARTTFRMDAIYEAVGRVLIGETGHVRVIDSNGVVIADPHLEHVGEQMPPSWITPDIIQAVSHWDELTDEEGVPMLVGHATIFSVEVENVAKAWAIQPLGWVLFVQQTQAEAYAPVASAIRTSFVSVGAFALVAAGLAFVIARAVGAPITELVGAARQMAAGDLSARARARRRDETGELAEAFNSMAEEVAGMVGTLEQEVAERTADLRQRATELERLTRNLENAVDESSRRAQRLGASAQVSRAIVSVLDPDELLSQVVDLIADRVGFYHVGVFLLDETGRYAVLRAANSVGGQRMLARGHRLGVGEQGIVGYVTGTGRPRVALDVGADAVFFNNPDLPQTRSEVALPLTARGRILGALDIQSLEPEAFDEEDVTVLQTLADQIAVALDNARLFEAAQASLQEARALQAQYALQGWRGFAVERGTRPTEYTRAGVTPLGDQRLPEIDQTVATGEVTVIHGDGDGQTPASLVVPIKLHGQTVGVLGLQETEPGRVWTEDEVALAQAVSEQMIQALESARLFEDAQRRARREQIIGQIATQIRASDEVEEILRIAAQELGRTLGVSRAIVRLDVGGTFPPTTTDLTS